MVISYSALNSFYFRSVLGGLWMLFTLNILFRVELELYRTGYLSELMRGAGAGVEITELVLFSSAITLQLPLLMTLLTLVLPMVFVRYMSTVLALLLIAVVVATHPYADLDDLLFMLMELIALVLLVVVVKMFPVTKLAPVANAVRVH